MPEAWPVETALQLCAAPTRSTRPCAPQESCTASMRNAQCPCLLAGRAQLRLQPWALLAGSLSRRSICVPACLPACSFTYHSPLPLPPCCSLCIHCPPAFVPLPVDGVPPVVLCEPVCFQDVCLVRCDRVSDHPTKQGHYALLYQTAHHLYTAHAPAQWLVCLPCCAAALLSCAACSTAGSRASNFCPRRHVLLCIDVSLPRC